MASTKGQAPPQIEVVSEEIAIGAPSLLPASLQVIAEVSAEDRMHLGNKDHYYRVGSSALRLISLALELTEAQAPRTILDLPCGHGRVLRFLKAGFPRASITACDISRDGVDFCAQTFGAIPLYGTEDPRALELEQRFDLIWCGSLLTHLKADRWEAFLSVFEGLLAPKGVLVFTTNGRTAAELLRIVVDGRGSQPEAQEPPRPKQGLLDDQVQTRGDRYFTLPEPKRAAVLAEYDRTGFGYEDYDKLPGYGQSVASPAWLARELEKHRDLRLVAYMEQAWDAIQDVVACAHVDWSFGLARDQSPPGGSAT